MEFHLSTEVAWGLLPQVDGATDETEDLDEFCDHFGGHPKMAGRTFTGGAERFFESGNLRAETGNWRHSGRNWVEGGGAFAPEAWVRSASRPYPFFRFAWMSVIRGALKRKATAIATMLGFLVSVSFLSLLGYKNRQ